MSWSLTVEKTHVKEFAAAVDAARATGSVAEGIAGLQITQAKAMLTALAAAGTLGTDVEIEARAYGHGLSPTSFQVYVNELVEMPGGLSGQGQAAASGESSGIESIPPGASTDQP